MPLPIVDLAEEFAFLLRVTNNTLPTPEREYHFNTDHRWRFDFAWPKSQVAVEINGGRWMTGGGRHATDADHWKIASATSSGWRVLQITVTMLRTNPWRVLELLEATLALSQTSEWQTAQPRVQYITHPPAGPCSSNGDYNCETSE